MAEVLKIPNFPDENQVEQSSVNADAAKDQATVTAKNIQDFAVDDYFVIGRLGYEQAEIKKILSISGQIITATTNFDFDHKRFESLVRVRGNQIKAYRAANVDGSIPADGSFASIVTLTIESDKLFSYHNDTTGGDGFWYKHTYFNSDTSDETDLSDIQAFRGGEFGHYATIPQIRKEAGFENVPELTDDFIADKRIDAESVVKGTLSSAGFTLPLADPVPGIVENATKLLAAAYILLSDYGTGADGTNKDGESKLKIANDLLKQIQDKRVELVDIQGANIDQSSKLAGWPNASTEDADPEDAGGDQIFRISKKY